MSPYVVSEGQGWLHFPGSQTISTVLLDSKWFNNCIKSRMFSHDVLGNIPSPLRLDVHVVELNPYVPLHVAQCLLGV